MRFITTFVLFAGMAAAQCGFLGLGCRPSPTPPSAVKAAADYLVPTFQAVAWQSRINNWQFPVNDTFFASDDTALALAKRFGAGRIDKQVSIDNPSGYYFYTAGPDKGKKALYNVLVFEPGAILRNAEGQPIGQVLVGFTVNAGLLADNFRRNPEAKFPPVSYVYGNPPVEHHLLSLPEQNVWVILLNLSRESEADAKPSKDRSVL